MALPVLEKETVVNLVAYLRKKSWSQRPPDASARVLAFMVELWASCTPFPTRPEVARSVGVSVPTVDLVLRRHRHGDLMIVYDGGIPVVRSKRWVVPSSEIISAALTSGPARRRDRDAVDRPARVPPVSSNHPAGEIHAGAQAEIL